MKARDRIVKPAAHILAVALAAAATLEASAKTDRLGKTPTYWIDLDGVQAQYGSETLTPSAGSGFRPQAYEPITYWGRKGCWNFGDAHNTNFKCGTGSFTMFVVARGGCDYTDRNAVVFCLGPKTPSSANGQETIELSIKSRLAKSEAGDPKNEVIVRTWNSANTTPSEIIRVAVPGCYASFRYVPYALAYDSSTHVVTLYANGVALASSSPGEFSGFSNDTCWWQVNSVRGGMPDTAVQRDCVGITDFRYYKELLNASQVATISSDYPLADQTGEMPLYHYAFNGLRHYDSMTNLSQTLGTARARNQDDYYGYRGRNGRDYFFGYSCETMRDGVCAAFAFPKNACNYGDYWPLTNSFTFVLSARQGASYGNSVIFSLGSAESSSAASHGSLALVSRALGAVGLDTWSTGLSRQEGITAHLGCVDSTHYHQYAITYDKDAGKVSLHVDGMYCGSMAHGGFENSDEDGIHGRWSFTVTSGGVSGLPENTDYAVEEFRFYTKVLTDAQLRTLSAACPEWHESSDPTGQAPRTHYSFDGEAVSTDHHLIDRYGVAIADSSFTVESYSPLRGGASHAARMARSGTNTRLGSELQTNLPFTVFMSARAGRFDMNGVLFSIGASSVSGLALAYKDPNTIGLFKWPSTGYVCTAPVNGGAFGGYHAYAFTVDPGAGTVSLYVDGVLADDGACGANPAGNGHWQFAGVYGGMPSGLSGNSYFDVEDFRIYVPALTDSQVATLSACYPSWRELPPTGVLPDYWYTFNAEGGVPKGARLFSTGRAYTQFPVGDSPARNGTFACTNTTRISHSYGAAGSISVGTEFTIFASARIKKSNTGKSGVVFGLGSPVNGDAETLAFASEATSAVSLYSWPGGTKTLLLTAPVPGMDEDFNAYAVTWNGTTLTLYLNGNAVASRATGTDFAGFTSGPKWQLGGGLYGGHAAGTEGAVCTMEDFRLYPVCLTAAQVAEVSAALPRWPYGWIWEGGDSGSWQSSVWKGWDWTAAACGNWVTGRALPAGANARFFESSATLQLTGALSPAAGHVQIDRPVALSGQALNCSALSVADGASLRPATVSGLLSPGVPLAIVPPAQVEGIDMSQSDAYGNRYYFTGSERLRYGDGSVPGSMIIVK